MARVAIDVVPELGRPEAVFTALGEAVELRDRLRQASEELAAAQGEYERQQQVDVENAAERARKGSPLGTIPPAVEKARAAVELAKRTAAAIGLASQAAQDDVATTILASAGEWRSSLDAEAERGREAGRTAIAELQAACKRIGDAASARRWLDAAGQTGDYGHQPMPVWTAGAAPSSARRTANGEALRSAELFDFIAELIDPPEPKPPVRLHTAAEAAADAA